MPCNGCLIKDGGCGKNGFSQSSIAPYTYVYRCSGCRFILCVHCVEKYWDVPKVEYMPKTVKTVVFSQDLQCASGKQECGIKAAGLECQGEGKETSFMY